MSHQVETSSSKEIKQAVRPANIYIDIKVDKTSSPAVIKDFKAFSFTSLDFIKQNPPTDHDAYYKKFYQLIINDFENLLLSVAQSIHTYKIYDNTLLLWFCDQLSILSKEVKAAIFIIKNKFPEKSLDTLKLNSIISAQDAILATAERYSNHLQQAIDICTYEIHLPEAEFDRRMKESKTNHFVFSTFTSKRAFSEGIKPEWIINPKESNSIDEKNKKRTDKVFYVLDARNPSDVYEQGIFYLPKDLNPLGNIIGFLIKEQTYKQFIENCEQGALFDPYGGWRISHGWTDSQRDALSIDSIHKKLFEAINATPVINKIMPQTLITIIVGYAQFSFFSPKQKTPEVTELAPFMRKKT